MLIEFLVLLQSFGVTSCFLWSRPLKEYIRIILVVMWGKKKIWRRVCCCLSQNCQFVVEVLMARCRLHRNLTLQEYYCYDKLYPIDTVDTFTTGTITRRLIFFSGSFLILFYSHLRTFNGWSGSSHFDEMLWVGSRIGPRSNFLPYSNITVQRWV